MSDPRACKIPMTEFNHLSLAEIEAFEHLDKLFSPVSKGSNGVYQTLLSRRVNPDRGHNKGDAA